MVPNEEIRRSGAATLGDLLFSKPGITGSSFAPGASSRPIIRGLDVNRVGIVENGVGAGGVSDLGEDHFVPIDPLASSQIEVIRGPAALRYGSTSIGGVVSGTNNRIPDALPNCAAAPFQTYGLAVKAPAAGVAQPSCATTETRTAVSSVDRGVEGGILLDAGGGNFAIHADAYGRKAGDYAIPSYPYLTDPTNHSTGVSQTPRRRPTAHRSAALIFSTAALSAPRSPRTTRSIIFQVPTARITTPASMRIRPNSPPRPSIGRTPPGSRRSGSGPAPRITGTMRSALRIRTIRPPMAYDRLLPTRSRRRALKSK